MTRGDLLAAADALAARAFVSPNVEDSNGEPANVVDALDKIGRGLHRIADALESIAESASPYDENGRPR